MANLEIITSLEEENTPPSVDRLNVIVWARGGREDQIFGIGNGVNFNASVNFWAEIQHSVQGIPLFHTRTLFHGFDLRDGDLEAVLERFRSGESDVIGLGGEFLPKTAIIFRRQRHSYTDQEGVEQEYQSYELTLSIDMGAVYRQDSPGNWMHDIHFRGVDLEDGLRFMGELLEETARAHQGFHPDPASVPPELSVWPLARDLNRRAYDNLANSFRDDYFAQPAVAQAFDAWLDDLPTGGHILDAGCGHGEPVISRLLERGFQVTGSDLSPAMLARAREAFPQAEFLERSTGSLEFDAIFDGACSFSSLVYQDPIDLMHSIYRLQRALKTDGLLFLYGYDYDPSWRGNPYRVVMRQWMWGNYFGMDELAQVLEEHGYFEVLRTLDITPQENQPPEEIDEAEEEPAPEPMKFDLPDGGEIELPPFPKLESAPAQGYIVIARKCK